PELGLGQHERRVVVVRVPARPQFEVQADRLVEKPRGAGSDKEAADEAAAEDHPARPGRRLNDGQPYRARDERQFEHVRVLTSLGRRRLFIEHDAVDRRLGRWTVDLLLVFRIAWRIATDEAPIVLRVSTDLENRVFTLIRG